MISRNQPPVNSTQLTDRIGELRAPFHFPSGNRAEPKQTSAKEQK